MQELRRMMPRMRSWGCGLSEGTLLLIISVGIMPLSTNSFATSPYSGGFLASARDLCGAPSPLLMLSRKQHRAARAAGLVALRAAAGAQIKTPSSIEEMMQDVSKGVALGLEGGVKRMIVEVPLPITGGTELDDWPGGIGQKYETLRQMIPGTLKALGFSAEQIASREFLSLSDDAIGFWTRTQEDGTQLSVVAFATPEVLEKLQALADKGTVVLINHQFFLDQFSKQQTKDFIASFNSVYFLQSLNMKGPGLLPIKGVLKRVFPDKWIVGRRVDAGVFDVLKEEDSKPEFNDMTALFFKDSEERDKNLSFFDRLKKLGNEATNI